MEQGRQLLDAVDQAWPGAGPLPVRVDGVHHHASPGAARPRRGRRPAPAPRPGRTRTAPPRPRRDGRRARRPRSPAPTSPRRVPSTGSPPAAVTISGIQWPGAYGGSVHSSTTTRGRGRPRTRERTASSRSRSDPTRVSAVPSCPVARPTATTESSTSSSVCGSTVSTSAVHPRWARASSTTVTSTAQTAQRSWVTTRSASRSARASASRR